MTMDVGARAVGVGVAVEAVDCLAVAFVVVFAFVAAVTCDVLLAAWLVLVDDVQPATLTISTARIPRARAVLNRFIPLSHERRNVFPTTKQHSLVFLDPLISVVCDYPLSNG